eukprot:gene5834-8049_t
MNQNFLSACSISSLESDVNQSIVDIVSEIGIEEYDNIDNLNEDAELYDQLKRVNGIKVQTNFTATSDMNNFNDLKPMGDNAYTWDYFLTKPVQLNTNNDSFSEIDYNDQQSFELTISSLSPNEIVTITVTCIPDSRMDEELIFSEKRNIIGIDHQALSFSLQRKDEAEDDDIFLNFKPVLLNGEYSFALSASHGLSPGVYILTIMNNSEFDYEKINLNTSKTQTVRVSYKIYPAVRATPIKVNQQVNGRINANEYAYYRFVNTDPAKLVTIQVKPLFDDFGTAIGDPDLYVTNRFDGLVGITKDNYIWKSTCVDNDRIEIHPSDVNLPHNDQVDRQLDLSDQSQVFMIGVLGYREINEFELIVTLSNPSPIISLNHLVTNNASQGFVHEPMNRDFYSSEYHRFDASVSLDKYSFYSVQVDPLHVNQIVIKIGSGSASGSNNWELEEITNKYQINQQYGRSVYVTEEISSYGILPSEEKRAQKNKQHDENSVSKSLFLNENNSTESAYKDANKFFNENQTMKETASSFEPTVFISSHIMYPTANEFTWKATSINGTAVFIIEASEWKYTSGKCYFSIYGTPRDISQDNTNHQHTTKIFEMNVWNRIEYNSLNPALQQKCDLFLELFQDIDGNLLSQKDRSKLLHSTNQKSINESKKNFSSTSDININLDDFMLTYSEIEYISFIDILHEAKAVDGQIFYDLGSGCGKAILAAAFSDIKFLRCIGIEILPTLVQCTQAVINTLLSSSGQNDNRSIAPSMNSIRTGQRKVKRIVSTDTATFFSNNQNDGYAYDGNISSRPSSSSRYNTKRRNDAANYLINPTPFSPAANSASVLYTPRHNNKEFLNEADNEDMNTPMLMHYTNHLINQDNHIVDHMVHSPDVKEKLQRLKINLPLLEVKLGNIIEVDWSDGDLIFISSLCYSDTLLETIFEQGANLKAGSKIITLKKPLLDNANDNFQLWKTITGKMSWGLVELYVYVRKVDSKI